MILLDNIVFELQKAGGVSLVWRAVIEACEADPGLETVYLDSGWGKQNLFYPQHIDPSSIIRERGPLRLRRYSDVCIRPDTRVFHSSYFRIHRSVSVKNVVTVHDCIYEKFESGPRKHLHLWQKKRALRKADSIICVSHSTKKDLRHFYPWLDPDIVHVVHNGVGSDFFPTIQPTAPVSDAPPYLLYVGGRMKHKNFSASLALLQTGLAQSIDLNLHVVGGGPFSDAEHAEINELGLSKKVHHVGHVTNEQLNTEYNRAYALFYPSLYEGFGIPPLEAMAAGCPVICSDSSSIPEVVGDAGLLFLPENITEAEEHLIALAKPPFRAAVIERGLVNAAQFSWEKTGRQTCAVYKRLMA